MKMNNLLSTEQIEKLVSNINPIYESETGLVGSGEKDGIKYEVQITITRNEDDFIGVYF